MLADDKLKQIDVTGCQYFKWSLYGILYFFKYGMITRTIAEIVGDSLILPNGYEYI